MDDVPRRLDFDDCDRQEFAVGEAEAGQRLDVYLAPRLEGFSRAVLQGLIRRGLVLLNGDEVRPSARLHSGDAIRVELPAILPLLVEPEEIPLRILHEERLFAVIDKEPGMAVHPGRGRLGGTVANAIAHRYGQVGLRGGAYRPGIVHRLDLETSGVMVIARTEAAHAALSDAFRSRAVEKEYRAIVFGEPPHDQDRIDLPLGRDAVRPTRMAVRFDSGREARTDVEALERFGDAAHVRCRPRTGRTHQIRVHLANRGNPLLGDALYASGRRPPCDVPRLMLHALRLRFPHPGTARAVEVEAPLPADFRAVLEALRDP